MNEGARIANADRWRRQVVDGLADVAGALRETLEELKSIDARLYTLEQAVTGATGART